MNFFLTHVRDGACLTRLEELRRVEATGKGQCKVASFDRCPMFYRELKVQMMMMTDVLKPCRATPTV